MRWYDEHPTLANGLAALRDAPHPLRRALVKDCLGTLQRLAGNVLERHVGSFPLEVHRRRWYDDDPELWMLVHGLQHAGPTCHDAVADLLRLGTSRAA